jgi:hypothetical protein
MSTEEEAELRASQPGTGANKKRKGAPTNANGDKKTGNSKKSKFND